MRARAGGRPSQGASAIRLRLVHAHRLRHPVPARAANVQTTRRAGDDFLLSPARVLLNARRLVGHSRSLRLLAEVSSIAFHLRAGASRALASSRENSIMGSKTFVLISCLAGLALWIAPGCQICGEGAVCHDSDENHGSALCQSFCSRLSDCDELGGTSESDCVSSCDERRAQGGGAVDKGAQCVVDAACRASKDCPGAPFPPGGGSSSATTSGSSGTSGGVGGQSGSSSSGAGGASSSSTSTSGSGSSSGQTSSGAGTSSSSGGGPIPCVVNCDCPSGDVCYQGFCYVFKP